MTHVLIISHNMAKGGMERQLSVYLKYFDRTKINITLALLRNRIEYDIPDDINLIILNKKGKIDLKFFVNLYKLINSNDYEVINSKASGCNEHLLLLSAFSKSKKIILEIRSSGKRMIKYYRRMKYLSFFNKNRPIIVCNSKKAENELQTIFKKNEIIRIPNGVEIPIIPLKKSLNTSLLRLTLLGRVAPVKNIETIIYAALYLKNEHPEFKFQINIFGENNSIYAKSLKNTVAELQLTNILTFHNKTNEIDKVFSDTDIFILPSISEGVSNSLLEAICSKTFAICSVDADSDNILPNENKFETLNYTGLANLILRISNLSIEEKKLYIEALYDKVCKEYSLNKMLTNYTELFQSK